MPSRTPETRDIVVTGLGVTTAVGQGKDDFIAALLHGRHAFAPMRRPGRQMPSGPSAGGEGPQPPFLGAEIAEFTMPDALTPRKLRTASLSSRVALATLDEAWQEARLADVDPSRIALVVGGSNVQQRELALVRARHAERPEFLRPTYGMAFMDTDLCGFCTEQFPIRGFAHTSAPPHSAAVSAMARLRARVRELDRCMAR